jgi:protein phosphatase
MCKENDQDTDEFLSALPQEGRYPRGISTHIQVDLGAWSDRGKVRPKNEDHYLVASFDRSMQTLLTNLPPGHIPQRYGETVYSMLVADGMGGHAAGEVASTNAISLLVDLVLETPMWILPFDDSLMLEVRHRMEQRFQQVQKALTEQARENPSLSGMGTTLTLVAS